jgi:RimJ/RimL family protein N-acetyltransferase
MTPTQPEDEKPSTLSTDRLILRLADPRSSDDCERVLQVVQDGEGGKGGVSRVGLNCIDDVRYKHELHGPRQEFCTLAPAPRGMIFLIFRPCQEEDQEQEGDFIGMIALSSRREMPFPDLGWAVLGPHQGHGYATEAGKAALKFWTEIVGVREVCAMVLDGNARSVRLAERIGFVKAGTVDIWFGEEGKEQKVMGRGLVLPGMEWRDGLWIRPTVVRPEGWRWKCA